MISTRHFAEFLPSSAELTISPTGVVSAEAFGSARVDLNVAPGGVPSAEAFGLPDLTAPQTVSPTGVASGEVFGVQRVDLNLAPGGIASVEAFGTAVIDKAEVGARVLSEAVVFVDVNPEVPSSLAEALMLVLETQDAAPSGRRQPIKHGSSRVTWEEP